MPGLCARHFSWIKASLDDRFELTDARSLLFTAFRWPRRVYSVIASIRAWLTAVMAFPKYLRTSKFTPSHCRGLGRRGPDSGRLAPRKAAGATII